MMLLIFFGVVASAAQPSSGSGVEPKKIEKREILADPDFKFQVSLNGRNGQVSVSTLKRNKKAPRAMSVTIFTDPETSQTIQLRALNLSDPFPRYQGQLAQNVGSYIGIELRFETSAKAIKVLRSLPPIPPQGK